MNTADDIQVVTFRVGDQEFAFDILQIERILRHAFDYARAHVNPWPLLLGRVHAYRVEADGVHVTVERDKQGDDRAVRHGMLRSGLEGWVQRSGGKRRTLPRTGSSARRAKTSWCARSCRARPMACR